AGALAPIVEASPAHAAGTIWRVGPTRSLTKPSQAVAFAQNGDTVIIDPGDYHGDSAIWTQNDLTLVGTPTQTRLFGDGPIPNAKAIWVTQGARITIEGIDFTATTVPDQNGAGIRAEGAGLTIRNSRFYNNENGILTSANPSSDILIEASEFSGNGRGDGFTHNIYIGGVKSFTLRSSWIHGAKVGHNVKSRALDNTIEYNRIDDEEATTSYSIDLPNAGNALIRGNVIRQGPNGENSALISYGAESGANPGRTLNVINNTFVNDRAAGNTFMTVVSSGVNGKLMNSLVFGTGTMLGGSGAGGVIEQATVRTSSGVVNKSTLDMHLTASSPARDAGVDPGALKPAFEYTHPMSTTERLTLGPTDVGAYEYAPVVSVPPTPAPSAGFQPMTPTRIVDTRTGSGGGRLIANIATRFTIGGRNGVPANATGVHLNVTGVGQSGDGFVSLYPCEATPTVSNLNLSGSKPAPNAVTVGLDTNGELCVIASVDTDIVMDLSGWFGPTATNRYRPIDNPVRAVDTRTSPLVKRMPANTQISLTVTAANATAVNLNVTAVDPKDDGFLTVFPCAAGRPNTSNLNPAAGVTRANLAVVPVDANDNVCIYTYAETDVVVDMAGTWAPNDGGAFQAVTPTRVIDSRIGQGATRLTPDTVATLTIGGVPGGATAVHVNATEVGAVGAGFLTFWPCDQPRPLASNVNFPDGRPVPNAAAVRVAPGGTICVVSNVTTAVIVDVFGFYLS
ncbi:MAG: hypothetical protein IT181_07035, partial [Acidobacteria bacterium]|nr:hypothetical protein [Acidobacteriota bacterium]